LKLEQATSQQPTSATVAATVAAIVTAIFSVLRNCVYECRYRKNTIFHLDRQFGDVRSRNLYCSHYRGYSSCHDPETSACSRSVWIIFVCAVIEYGTVQLYNVNPLSPNASNCYALSYRPNLPFSTFNVRSLALPPSARLPECQKLTSA